MNAKVKHEFVVGSSAFFGGIEGFVPKDNDKVCVLDVPLFGDRIMNIRKDGKDLFFMPPTGKEEMLAYCVKQDFPLAAGKFLVPDFAGHIGLTVDDLKVLEPLIMRMDAKHQYERVIYGFYLENGEFRLTEEQRQKAYETYKAAR